ncbi:voltage-gated potassium channel [Thozetella sp. PMI_491]|nr:voltage-gated potassium channel [Thozetella sp. PMI_491]
MNDADLGERVEDHAEAIEDSGKSLSKRMSNDEAHLDPSRWWFASSGFPMIAGTLGPVASAFSILCLVRPWRQHFVPGPGADIQKAEYVPDTKWVIAINAVQLAIALIANFFLLLNMTRKVRFSISLPVTIVGWYLSAIFLIALTGTGGGPLLLEPHNEYVWSQAFYYGVYAAVLYFIVASLLVVTYMGALAGHYDKDFQLTTAQRTLMLQTIMFLMYLLVGALVFSTIEGWNYLDAVYWADVTLFTVGFGDLYAQTTLGRALLIPYALVGVISLGLVIGSIRSLILERGRRKLDARMLEKKRRDLLRRMTTKGRDGILEPVGDTPDSASRLSLSTQGQLTELERREHEFNLMRKVQQKSEKRRRWAAMALSTGTWLVLWLVGAKIFQNCEAEYQNWSYWDSFYFAFVSLTTIGYGDVTPISNAGKSFFVFWSLLALPTMTVLISNAGDTIVKSIRDATNRVGEITILPSDRGFKKEFKEVCRMMSFGRLFGHDSEEEDESANVHGIPPGFLGEAQPRQEDDDDDTDLTEDLDDEMEKNLNRANKEVEEAATAPSRGLGNATGQASTSSASSTTQRPTSKQISFHDPPKPSGTSSRPLRKAATMHHNSNQQPMGPSLKRAVSMPRQDLPVAIPVNKADYRVLLIDEITRVMSHLKSHPPRKYSYQEWVWYLRLIGEDESNPETHRKAQPHRHGHKLAPHQWHMSHLAHDDQQKEHSTKPPEGETKTDERKPSQWSWVGSRSPLMGSQEEAEWILERLTERLAEELRGARSEEKRGGRRLSHGER